MSAPKRQRFSLAEAVLLCTDPSQVLEDDLPMLDGDDSDVSNKCNVCSEKI